MKIKTFMIVAIIMLGMVPLSHADVLLDFNRFITGGGERPQLASYEVRRNSMLPDYDKVQQVVPELNYNQRIIESHYGVAYDLTYIGQDFDPSDLIITVANLPLEFDIEVNGVIVMDEAKMMNPVILAKTTESNGMNKYVLMISRDMAFHPQDIVKVLRNEDYSLREEQNIENKEVQREILSSFFSSDNVKEDEKNTLGAKIIEKSGNMIGKFENAVSGSTGKKQAQLSVYALDFNFDQIFTLPGNGDAQPSANQVISEKSGEIINLDEPAPAVVSLSSDNAQRIFYDEGNIFQEIIYDEANDVNHYREFYENGSIKLEMTLKDGMQNGDVKGYSQDGVLMYVESYKDGQLNGLAKQYYASGIIKSERTFKNDLLNGISREYNEEGQMIFDFYFVNNEKHGQQNVYYDSGQIFKQASYSNGVENGVYREYFENGNVQMEMFFLNGDRYGSYEEFYENGNMKYVENYKDGKLHGSIQEYYENGVLKFEDQYRAGVLHGVSKDYFPSGKVKTIYYYESGDLVGAPKEYTEESDDMVSIDVFGMTKSAYNFSKDPYFQQLVNK